MLELNKVGQELGKIQGVTAITDVTGFGLLGHLIELCEGSNVSAKINFFDIPIIDSTDSYLNENCIPGGTIRNFESYSTKVSSLNEKQRNILCDPQTSGGLLVAVSPPFINTVEKIFKIHDLDLKPFGEIVRKKKLVVEVNKKRQ